MNDKIQIAIRVNDDKSLKDLNDHLEMGWKVASMVSMPSSVAVSKGNGYDIASREIRPTCLVIIEGENSE